MNRRVIPGVVITVVMLGALAAVGVYAYSWGVAQGVMQNTQIVVPNGDGAAMAPVYPYGVPFHHHGFGRWGMSFGPPGCLLPLLGIFLVFALVRGLFGGWGGWRRHGWGGPSHYGGPQAAFEEWHRRAHGESAPPPQTKSE